MGILTHNSVLFSMSQKKKTSLAHESAVLTLAVSLKSQQTENEVTLDLSLRTQ